MTRMPLTVFLVAAVVLFILYVRRTGAFKARAAAQEGIDFSAAIPGYQAFPLPNKLGFIDPATMAGPRPLGPDDLRFPEQAPGIFNRSGLGYDVDWWKEEGR